MKPKILFFFLMSGCGFIFCCAGVNNRLDIEKSGIQYSRPHASTKLIKGNRVAYRLWVDSHKWQIYDANDREFIDFSNMQGDQGAGLSHVLKHRSGESMAVIQEIRTPADFGTLHKSLSESLSMGMGSILKEEIRTVNGKDVLFVKWMEDLGTSKIVWLSYYLSNGTGHMRLAGGTTEKLLTAYETDIVELLNGLVDSEGKMPPAVTAEEDIEKKLSKLKRLLKSGLITQQDYDTEKAELLENF